MFTTALQHLVSEKTSQRGPLCCTSLFAVRRSCLTDHHLLGISIILTKRNEPFQFFRRQRQLQKKFCAYVRASGLRTLGKIPKTVILMWEELESEMNLCNRSYVPNSLGSQQTKIQKTVDLALNPDEQHSTSERAPVCTTAISFSLICPKYLIRGNAGWRSMLRALVPCWDTQTAHLHAPSAWLGRSKGPIHFCTLEEVFHGHAPSGVDLSTMTWTEDGLVFCPCPLSSSHSGLLKRKAANVCSCTTETFPAIQKGSIRDCNQLQDTGLWEIAFCSCYMLHGSV